MLRSGLQGHTPMSVPPRRAAFLVQIGRHFSTRRAFPAASRAIHAANSSADSHGPLNFQDSGRFLLKISTRWQVEAYTFGSVPLKTYLPDGDIDLSAFQLHPTPAPPTMRDTWANKMAQFLEQEQANPNAPFKIRDVQVIYAEVSRGQIDPGP